MKFLALFIVLVLAVYANAGVILQNDGWNNGWSNNGWNNGWNNGIGWNSGWNNGWNKGSSGWNGGWGGVSQPIIVRTVPKHIISAPIHSAGWNQW